MLNVSTVASKTNTKHYQVLSVTPAQTTNAKGVAVSVDEICVDWDHEIVFAGIPLPESAKTFHIQSVLHIFSDAKEGKIVRLMDHSKEELQEHSLPNVSWIQAVEADG